MRSTTTTTTLAAILITLLALLLTLIPIDHATATSDPSPGRSLGAGADTAAEPAATSGCGTDRTPGNDARTITSAGEQRTYRLNVPRDYDPTTPMPLILGFHGNGSDGAEFQTYTGIPGLPAISAFPDGVLTDGKRSWQGAPYASGADDVAFVAAVLDEIESEYCIDRNRVFATGKSNGGGMVSVLACTAPERFAAFATVAGAYYPQSTMDCDHSAPRSILAIHGTGDATMRYEGGTRHGETYPGVRDWIQPWVEAADCRVMSERGVGRKGEEVLRTRWKRCADGTAVELYSVTNGGHVWPGEEAYSGGGYVTEHFSATATIWRFFEDHPADSSRSPRT